MEVSMTCRNCWVALLQVILRSASTLKEPFSWSLDCIAFRPFSGKEENTLRSKRPSLLSEVIFLQPAAMTLSEKSAAESTDGDRSVVKYWTELEWFYVWIRCRLGLAERRQLLLIKLIILSEQGQKQLSVQKPFSDRPIQRARGPFLVSPENFSGPKSHS